jgi:predicted  nucleic acid-binding Zn-ribbon protein
MREIHRLRRFARDLQEQLDRFPRQLKAQQARVVRQEEHYKEAQEKLKHLKVVIHEKEVSLKTAHSQIKKYEKQQDDIHDKKEFDALKAQIATAQENCRRLEDEILEAMSELEERTAALPGEAKTVEQVKADFAAWETTTQERRGQQEAQMKETQAKLKEAEVEVPSEVRVQYQRMVNAMGPDALAAVQDRSCSACRTEITAQMYNDLQQEHFVACKACGRILYLPEAPAGEPE